MANQTITITNNVTGETFNFPLRSGSIGPSAADISSLYKEAGIFTYDPGFMSTA
ncbi:MAG: citrate (Si)-synthase, partial [Gammaproteobacteria bacterium]|nr:citrate (Si)-synthase [Gammaproteobacteria bacterium]